MKQARRIRPIAVACMALTLSVLVGAWLIAPRPAFHPPVTADGPWIPLPRSGMDAGGYDMRMAVSRGFLRDDDTETPVALSCGANPNAPDEPHYRAWIGDGFSEAPYRTWKIDIIVRGNTANVSVREAPSPPMPPRSIGPRNETWVTPARLAVVPLDALEPVRRAWDTEAVWHRTQERMWCDGRTAFLEACVAGRYAARDRGCDLDRGIAQLWSVFQMTLPTPEAGRWERR